MIKTITIAAFLLITFLGYGQSKSQQDSIAKEKLAVDKFIDSITINTSIKSFNLWLYESVSQKQYAEGKFADLWSLFMQQKYDLWVRARKK